jgi:hypothetical protein
LALLVGSAGAVLWLNTALAQGSFEIHELETKLEHLEVQRDVINEQLVARAEPDALAAKAAELGMVESPATGYILVREGTVIGAAPAAGSEAETEAETEASEPSQETAVPTGEETIDTASDGDE